MRIVPVSLVIPISNESMALPSLFRGLCFQTTKPKEIIFVISGNEDRSATLAETWASQGRRYGFQVVVLHRPRAFPGAARNAGVSVASQPWIGFIDAGIVPHRDWLAELWAGSAGDESAAIFGYCKFHSRHLFGTIVCALSYGYNRIRPVLPASLFHKNLFAHTGLFDEQLRSGEDILWMRSLDSHGVTRVERISAIVEYTHFPVNINSALKKWFIYEQSATVAGIGGVPRTLLFTLICILYFGALAGVGGAFWLLALYLLLRGLIDPIRRSASWRWWCHWWQPIAAIPVAALLDLSSAAGRISAILGFRTFQAKFMREVPPR